MKVEAKQPKNSAGVSVVSFQVSSKYRKGRRTTLLRHRKEMGG